MNRKFSELTPSEQIQFQGLVDFMKETWNEDIGVKLNIVKKFRLDIKDPVVYDFLTDVYVPQPRPDLLYDDPPPSPQPAPVAQQEKPTLPVATSSASAVEKTKKRAMSYANSEDLIVVQNRLLHAISNLTLNERRLILFLSPIVRKQIEKNPTNRIFYVLASDFANEYKLKGKSVYSELEKTADSIVEKAFFFWYNTENGKAKKGVSWVSECDYIENKAKIKVKLDDTVIEMLTVFDKNTGNFWTQYQKEWIINLGSYGIVMLEMVLSSVENKGYYTVEHLREKFDCVDSYSVFADFKRHVIDKAIKEIHKHTPITVSYEVDKSGRQTQGLKFCYTDISKSVEINRQNSKTDKSKEKNPFINFKMTKRQLSMFAGKIRKASGQDVEEIIAELSNVHLQSKHIGFLKVLDYTPSAWYSEKEIKNHLTAEQIVAQKEQVKKEKADKAKKEKEQQERDFNKLLTYAEEFVTANLDKVNKNNIEGYYLKEKNYEGIIEAWQRGDKQIKTFALVDEILAR